MPPSNKKAFCTLASLHNHGVFRAGGFLIGTHAYGALLNALGVRAVPFRVDLLVPSKDETYPIVPVPELKAHATGLPYLAYLLGSSQTVPILSAHGVVEVRVPTAERYAAHKLVVSQLRGSGDAKSGKDLQQAAVLVDALADRFPGATSDAVDALPKSARRAFRRGLKALRAHLPRTAEAAWESLEAGHS
jgi:hypothetical protein